MSLSYSIASFCTVLFCFLTCFISTCVLAETGLTKWTCMYVCIYVCMYVCVYEFLAKNKMTVWPHNPTYQILHCEITQTDITGKVIYWQHHDWSNIKGSICWVSNNSLQKILQMAMQSLDSLYKVPTTIWSYHINYTNSNFIHPKELR